MGAWEVESLNAETSYGVVVTVERPLSRTSGPAWQRGGRLLATHNSQRPQCAANDALGVSGATGCADLRRIGASTLNVHAAHLAVAVSRIRAR